MNKRDSQFYNFNFCSFKMKIGLPFLLFVQNAKQKCINCLMTHRHVVVVVECFHYSKVISCELAQEIKCQKGISHIVELNLI